MTKHTPGPWHYERIAGEHNISPSQEQGDRVAIACKFTHEYAVEANARLIAAAPELYESLRHAQLYLLQTNHMDEDRLELTEEIRHVLLKVEGR